MSYDIYFWFRAYAEPDDVTAALAEEDGNLIEPAPAVSAFREDLLTRFPRCRDYIEPAGLPELVSHYVALTLPFDNAGDIPVVVELARRHGLCAYDPQTEEMYRA